MRPSIVLSRPLLFVVSLVLSTQWWIAQVAASQPNTSLYSTSVATSASRARCTSQPHCRPVPIDHSCCRVPFASVAFVHRPRHRRSDRQCPRCCSVSGLHHCLRGEWQPAVSVLAHNRHCCHVRHSDLPAAHPVDQRSAGAVPVHLHRLHSRPAVRARHYQLGRGRLQRQRLTSQRFHSISVPRW